jgi:hypothetical protein
VDCCQQVRHLCVTGKKKGLTMNDKSLIYLVGREGFEPSTR